MAAAPLIGIPTRTRTTATGTAADEMRRAYAAAVVLAGGIPVLLPHVGDPLIVLPSLDGVLLAGGCDIGPHCYGEEPHPHLGEVDPTRDEVELELAHACIDRRIPVLGLCRGHQVLAVASGGALWQDLPTQAPSSIVHDQEVSDAHTVRIAIGSRLHAITGMDCLEVNSRHHQAAKTLGNGWRATAWAADGIVEGIEALDHPFAIGVQWHPEDLQDHAPHRCLLAAFILAARQVRG